MIDFVMCGAAGRMGRSIIALSESPDFALNDKVRLSSALEWSGSDFLGQDAGIVSGIKELGVKIDSDQSKALDTAKVVIDFSSPESSLNLARLCVEKGVALAIGTTGFTDEQKNEILSFKNRIPVLLAPNMSVGVNMLFHLTAQAAKSLGDAYDVEVVEAHHHFKKDAPSGTAMRLKEVLLDSLDRTEENIVYGRHGADAPRQDKEIGVHTVRGGDTVGDHTVYFFTDGERLELTHRASSRNTFASGALRAALYLARAKPGEYTMKDILGL